MASDDESSSDFFAAYALPGTNSPSKKVKLEVEKAEKAHEEASESAKGCAKSSIALDLCNSSDVPQSAQSGEKFGEGIGSNSEEEFMKDLNDVIDAKGGEKVTKLTHDTNASLDEPGPKEFHEMLESDPEDELIKDLNDAIDDKMRIKEEKKEKKVKKGENEKEVSAADLGLEFSSADFDGLKNTEGDEDDFELEEQELWRLKEEYPSEEESEEPLVRRVRRHSLEGSRKRKMEKKETNDRKRKRRSEEESEEESYDDEDKGKCGDAMEVIDLDEIESVSMDDFVTKKSRRRKKRKLDDYFAHESVSSQDSDSELFQTPRERSREEKVRIVVINRIT